MQLPQLAKLFGSYCQVSRVAIAARLHPLIPEFIISVYVVASSRSHRPHPVFRLGRARVFAHLFPGQCSFAHSAIKIFSIMLRPARQSPRVTVATSYPNNWPHGCLTVG